MSATLHFHHRFTLPAALSLLPPTMDTLQARAMLLTIALHESRFLYRRQLHGGPARGFWQFEVGGGVTGVLTHSSTRPLIERVLTELRYVPAASACYDAIEHHDVLACVFARLLLWTIPQPLPLRDQVEEAYRQYRAAWRPNPDKARPQAWAEDYACAWPIVLEQS